MIVSSYIQCGSTLCLFPSSRTNGVRTEDIQRNRVKVKSKALSVPFCVSTSVPGFLEVFCNPDLLVVRDKEAEGSSFVCQPELCMEHLIFWELLKSTARGSTQFTASH